MNYIIIIPSKTECVLKNVVWPNCESLMELFILFMGRPHSCQPYCILLPQQIVCMCVCVWQIKYRTVFLLDLSSTSLAECWLSLSHVDWHFFWSLYQMIYFTNVQVVLWDTSKIHIFYIQLQEKVWEYWISAWFLS